MAAVNINRNTIQGWAAIPAIGLIKNRERKRKKERRCNKEEVGVKPEELKISGYRYPVGESPVESPIRVSHPVANILHFLSSLSS